MAHWQDQLHSVIAWAENADTYLAKGLAALNGNPNLSAFIAEVPMLAKFEGQLLRLVPGVGQALTIADIVVTDLPAIIAIGAAVHFAPADGDALAKMQGLKDQDR